MIKVDLLKNKAKVAGMEQASSSESKAPQIDSNLGPEFRTQEYGPMGQLLKLLLMFGFLGALVVMERVRGQEGLSLVNQKQQELDSLRAVDMEKESELSDFAQVESDLKKVRIQEREISSIKRGRLSFVASLDALQSAIDKEVWLTSTSLRETKILLEGKALAKENLDNFMLTLQQQPLFERAIVTKDTSVISLEKNKHIEFSVLVNLVENVGEVLSRQPFKEEELPLEEEVEFEDPEEV